MTHQNHFLSLLPRPRHTEAYRCDACDYLIHDASFYQCRECNIGLHVNCYPSHPHRPNLAFSTPPRSTGMCRCNRCTNSSTPPPRNTGMCRCNRCTNSGSRQPMRHYQPPTVRRQTHPAASNYVNNTNGSSNIWPNVGNVLRNASEGFAYGISGAAGYNFGQGRLGGGLNEGFAYGISQVAGYNFGQELLQDAGMNSGGD